MVVRSWFESRLKNCDCEEVFEENIFIMTKIKKGNIVKSYETFNAHFGVAYIQDDLNYFSSIILF